MTIHHEHPFVPAPGDRDQLRRFRGRLGPQTSLWTTGDPSHAAAGLTVSSLMVALGEPGHVLGLLDPDSELADLLEVGTLVAVQLLEWSHRDAGEQFAGQMPAPGGVFAVNPHTVTPFGPVLEGVNTWLGCRVTDLREVGWSREVTARVELVTVGEDRAPLHHRRGRWVRPWR